MTHDPASTTLTELIDHVKLHLTPEVHLDHLADYDVHAIVGLTMHSLSHFGLTIAPTLGERAGGGTTAAPKVGRIEPPVAVATELLIGACWRSSTRAFRRLAEWLDARLESPS